MRAIHTRVILFLAAAVVLGAVLAAVPQPAPDRSDVTPAMSDSRIQIGFRIAPVPLDLKGKNRGMVGLGSYLVNAVASCNDCHTCPNFAPGHDPYVGQDARVNAENYLAGGRQFGPFTSRNLTPDADGNPAGLTAQEFLDTIRTGHPPDDPPGYLLQVMPWPVLRNQADRDLLSIYEFLRSIPPASPGVCP